MNKKFSEPETGLIKLLRMRKSDKDLRSVRNNGDQNVKVQISNRKSIRREQKKL